MPRLTQTCHGPDRVMKVLSTLLLTVHHTPPLVVMEWLADGQFPSSVKEDLSDLQVSLC